MSTRIVSRVVRDREGRIAALVNEDEAWSPVSAASAHFDIEFGLHEYVVRVPDNPPAKILACVGPHRIYIRTSPDNSMRNNLQSLNENRDK